MKEILKSFYILFFNLMWRRKNKHNETTAKSRFNRSSVKVGKGTYGPLRVNQYNKDAKLVIGSYCSIADNVTFLLGGEHNYKTISSFPFNSKIYHVLPQNKQSMGGANITVGDDVWIGFGVIILSGVTIGTGTIIGAGSIVAKDIPPYSIYIGNRVIKPRFTENVISKLQRIDWNTIAHNKGDEYEDYVNTKINEDNIDDVLEAFLKK